MENQFSKKQKILTGIFVSIITLIIAFYLLFVNYVSADQIGVKYNMITGEVTSQKPGWYITHPLIVVSHINTLPIKVTIPSKAAIVVEKTVRFKPEGLQEYIELQGFSYNLNEDLPNILLGYAFSGKEYVFLKIIKEV